MEIILAILGATALILLAIIYDAFSYGYLLFKFWYWFVLPVFPQFMHITFYHAVGLFLVILLFKSKDTSDKTINGVEIKSKINWVGMLAAPWIILGIGWFVKLFL